MPACQLRRHLYICFPAANCPACRPPPLLQDRARRRLFAKRVKEVIAHNKDPATTWVASLNQFSASTKDELRGMLGLLPPPRAGASADRKLLMLGAEPEPELEAPGRRLLAVPSNFSWVDKGKVTSVKNQGSVSDTHALCAVQLLAPRQLCPRLPACQPMRLP